jgi:deazaflavin-dependent oxidoreductase (nitroreductase family)
MNRTTYQQVEKAFYRTLNQIVEPLLATGVGAPTILQPGLILLETQGRKTGKLYKTPLVAARVGRQLVVSSYRRNSQWVQNLIAQPNVRYWSAGLPGQATAYVFAPEAPPPSRAQLPAPIGALADALQLYSNVARASVAILSPYTI